MAPLLNSRLFSRVAPFEASTDFGSKGKARQMAFSQRIQVTPAAGPGSARILRALPDILSGC